MKHMLICILMICGENGWSYPNNAMTNNLKPVTGKGETKGLGKIDFIYVINLDQRPEKMQKCVEQFTKYGIAAHRFPAIYGWDLSVDAISDSGMKFQEWMSPINERWPEHSSVSFFSGVWESGILEPFFYGKACFHKNLSLGGIGCTLSHLSVLKDAIDSNYDLIWILEDDFLFQGDPRRLSDYIEKLDRLIGREEWDVLYTDRKCGPDELEENWVGPWRPDSPTFEPHSVRNTTDLNEEFSKSGIRYRTHSMVITRSGIEKILDFELTHGIFNPYDADLWYSGINAYSLKEDLITFSIDGSDTVYRNF